MGHDKTRSGVWIGNVDWNDPQLSALLRKAEGWKIDNRTDSPPQEVQIQVAGGWGDNGVSAPALLVSEADGAMVLVTRVPLAHGEHVRVNGQREGGQQTRWGVVVEGREGHRAEDREHGLYLNWLRPR